MLTFTEAQVRAALADPATADLPHGPAKSLLLELARGFDSYGVEAELVVRTLGRDDDERHRSAESGRFVTEEYAEANPATTVAERHPRAGWPCHAPGRIQPDRSVRRDCVNPMRCAYEKQCTWETAEACNPPRPGTV